jgi:hypothetical protein
MGHLQLCIPDCLVTKQHRQPQINVALSQPPTLCKCKAKGNRWRCSVKPSCDLSLVSSPAHLRPASRLYRYQYLGLSPPINSTNVLYEWKAFLWAKSRGILQSFDGFNKNQIWILCLARHLEFRRSVDRDIFLVYHINSFPSALTMGRKSCLTPYSPTPPCPLDYHSLYWSRLALTLPSSCAVLSWSTSW